MSKTKGQPNPLGRAKSQVAYLRKLVAGHEEQAATLRKIIADRDAAIVALKAERAKAETDAQLAKLKADGLRRELGEFQYRGGFIDRIEKVEREHGLVKAERDRLASATQFLSGSASQMCDMLRDAIEAIAPENRMTSTHRGQGDEQ